MTWVNRIRGRKLVREEIPTPMATDPSGAKIPWEDYVPCEKCGWHICHSGVCANPECTPLPKP